MSERIVGLPAETVARLYDALHLMWTEARHSYLAAEHVAEEEFHRGRREAFDAVLSELDVFMDEASARVSNEDVYGAYLAAYLDVCGSPAPGTGGSRLPEEEHG